MIERKWLIVAGSFLARTISQGSVLCLGVYFDDVRDFLRHYSTAQVGVIFSIAFALVDCSGIVASALLQKFDAKYLCIAGSLLAFAGLVLSRFAYEYWSFLICFSILNGFGQGIPRAILPIAVSHSFNDKNRHVAVALQNVGDGVGGVLFPLLYAALIDVFTWRSSLLIVAAIVLHLVLAGLLIPRGLVRPATTAAAAATASSDDRCEELQPTAKAEAAAISWLPNLPLLMSNLIIHSIGYATFLTFLFSDLRLHNVSDEIGAAILATIGATSIIGRLFVTLIDDSSRMPRYVIYAIGHVLRGACVLIFLVAQYYAASSDTLIGAYFTLSAFFGLTDGITGALICIVALDLFGLDRVAIVYPVCLLSLGVGSLVGPPIAGVLKDTFDSYDSAFVFSGCAFVLSGLLMLPCFVRRTNKRRAVIT